MNGLEGLVSRTVADFLFSGRATEALLRYVVAGDEGPRARLLSSMRE